MNVIVMCTEKTSWASRCTTVDDHWDEVELALVLARRRRLRASAVVHIRPWRSMAWPLCTVARVTCLQMLLPAMSGPLASDIAVACATWAHGRVSALSFVTPVVKGHDTGQFGGRAGRLAAVVEVTLL